MSPGFPGGDANITRSPRGSTKSFPVCTDPGGTVGGGTLPCLINNYSNIEAPFYTFDLSLGYDTGDLPANNFLKHIGIQLVVQDLLDKHPPFEYRISTGGGNPAAFDILKDLAGRTYSLILTKTW